MPKLIHEKPPSSDSRRMAKVRQKDTAAEMAIRREIHKRGFRYRVDYLLMKKPRRVADLAFPGLRLAVFVDGCFWHGCPEHATWPKRNAEFWRLKIEANRLRDADTDARLAALGWSVIRFWEHESPTSVADKIASLVNMAKAEKSK